MPGTWQRPSPGRLVSSTTAPHNRGVGMAERGCGRPGAALRRRGGHGECGQPVGTVDIVGNLDARPGGHDRAALDLTGVAVGALCAVQHAASGWRQLCQLPDVLPRDRAQPGRRIYAGVLAEYGEYRQAAVYELQQAAATSPAAAQVASNQTRETATMLSPGVAVPGMAKPACAPTGTASTYRRSKTCWRSA